MNITPRQAQHVITQLLNDKRIAHHDITRALQHLQNETTAIKDHIASLQSLRATRSPARTAPNTIAPNTTTPNTQHTASNTPAITALTEHLGK